MAGLLSVTFGDRTIRFREQNLNVSSIALIFKLDPASIYLTSQPEGEIFLADDAGRFHVNGPKYCAHGDAKLVQQSRERQQPTFGNSPSGSGNLFSNLAVGPTSRTRFNPPPAARQLKRPRFTSPPFASPFAASSNWKKAFIHIEVDEERNVHE